MIDVSVVEGTRCAELKPEIRTDRHPFRLTTVHGRLSQKKVPVTCRLHRLVKAGFSISSPSNGIRRWAMQAPNHPEMPSLRNGS